MTEHDPVEDSEFVYRRIPAIYYDGTLTMPIQRDAFRPSANDTTGLSVVRASFATPQELLAGLNPHRAKDFYVARLAVRDLKNLGLTVVPDSVAAGPRGHAIIPELTSSAYQADKQRWKLILVELAKLAGADIVLGPV